MQSNTILRINISIIIAFGIFVHALFLIVKLANISFSNLISIEIFVLGNRLCALYVFIKLLYIVNCICQFEFLSFVLSFRFYTFGYEWLKMTFNKMHNRKINDQVNESKWFPRVVMCDFMVRHLGSNQHWMFVIDFKFKKKKQKKIFFFVEQFNVIFRLIYSMKSFS